MVHQVAGKVAANGLLKSHRFLGGDGEDGGEAKLADDLHQRIHGVLIPVVVGKQHGDRSFLSVG